MLLLYLTIRYQLSLHNHWLYIRFEPEAIFRIFVYRFYYFKNFMQDSVCKTCDAMDANIKVTVPILNHLNA